MKFFPENSSLITILFRSFILKKKILFTCPWSWWGRKSKKIRQTYNSNQRSVLQTKILKKWAKARHRAGSKTYWRKTVRQSPDLTQTTSWPLQKLTTSSLCHQLQCYCYQWYAYKAEWSRKKNPPPPIKQDFSKRRKMRKALHCRVLL